MNPRSGTTLSQISPALMLALVGWAHAAQADDGSIQPPPASAPDSNLNDAPPASTLQISFTPGVYLTRLDGDVKFGPGAPSLSLQNDFALDDQEAAFNGELAITKNDVWRLDFTGTAFSTSQSGTFPTSGSFGGLQLNPGDAFQSDFDLNSASGEFTYWLWQPYKEGKLPDGRECRLDLRFGPLVGVRYADVDQSLSVFGEGKVRAKGQWLAPMAGFQMQLGYQLPDDFPLLRRLEASVAASFGPALGGDGGTIGNIRAGLNFYFSRHFAFTFGYRLLQLDVSNNDYNFDGGLQGLFFGATARF